MNVERLLEVKAQILAEPEHFNMKDWMCGTTCCIGGHAAVLAGYVRPDRHGRPVETNAGAAVIDTGGDIYDAALCLNCDESNRLYVSTQWPLKFAEAYEIAVSERDHVAMARVAAERIDHFIETGGAE